MLRRKSSTSETTSDQAMAMPPKTIEHYFQEKSIGDEEVAVGNTNVSKSLDDERNISTSQIIESDHSETIWFYSPWNLTAAIDVIQPVYQKMAGTIVSGLWQFGTSLANGLSAHLIDEKSISLYRNFVFLNKWNTGIEDYENHFFFLKKHGLDDHSYNNGVSMINALKGKYENNAILNKSLSDLIFFITENSGNLKLNRHRLVEFEESMQNFILSLDDCKVDWDNLRAALIESVNTLKNFKSGEHLRPIDFPTLDPNFSINSLERINWESDDAGFNSIQELNIGIKLNNQKMDLMGFIFWLNIAIRQNSSKNSEFRLPAWFESKLPRIHFTLVKDELPALKSSAGSEILIPTSHQENIMIDADMENKGRNISGDSLWRENNNLLQHEHPASPKQENHTKKHMNIARERVQNSDGNRVLMPKMQRRVATVQRDRASSQTSKTSINIRNKTRLDPIPEGDESSSIYHKENNVSLFEDLNSRP